MKIQTIELGTKKPIAHARIQLQVKGGATLAFTTDANGYFELEDKFKGQQISLLQAGATGSSVAVAAEEGAVLYGSKQAETAKGKATETTASYK